MSERMDAALAGQLMFKGKPCKRCSSIFRYVSSAQCVTCSKKRAFKFADKVRKAQKAARGKP